MTSSSWTFPEASVFWFRLCCHLHGLQAQPYPASLLLLYDHPPVFPVLSQHCHQIAIIFCSNPESPVCVLRHHNRGQLPPKPTYKTTAAPPSHSSTAFIFPVNIFWFCHHRLTRPQAAATVSSVDWYCMSLWCNRGHSRGLSGSIRLRQGLPHSPHSGWRPVKPKTGQRRVESLCFHYDYRTPETLETSFWGSSFY